MPAPIKDLTGKVFGKLKVLSFHHTDGHSYWNCRCECGNDIIVKGKTLSSGKTKSCGCLSTEIKDLSARKFGRWTVVCFSHRDTRTYWVCKCECGNTKTIVGYALLNGDSKSCGCLKREVSGKASITHGLRRHPLYRVWANMKNRCYNTASERYLDWGGRGICVCDEWLEFSVFHAWGVSNGYKKGLTIERIDNDGNYCPSNCRWATLTEQANNKRNTLKVVYKGVLQPLAPLAVGSGDKVWQRISKYDWSVDRAIDTP